MIGGAAEKKVYDAASTGDVARFKQLLDEDPFLVNGASFACSRNLLHIATLCGQAGIVEAVLKISPRLARSLDSEKWSPLHIAAAEGNLEIAKKLLSVAPEMRWSRDWQGMNPVHIAAMNGHVKILQELLELDSLPAMERVHRGQTVLHLCVKHRQLEALEFLVEELADEFVSAKDDDGDTVLHWAVRSNQVEMVRCLVKSNKIERLAKNSMGKIASNILTKSSRDTSNNYSEMRTMLMFPSLSTFGLFGDHFPDMSGMIMVVAALIATIAYQTAASPPGGVWQDDSSTHKAGEAVMASTRPTAYNDILFCNALAFGLSITTIILISTGLLFESLRLQGLAINTMGLSVMSIAMNYIILLNGITPQTKNAQESLTITLFVALPFCMVFIFILLLGFKTYQNVAEFLIRRSLALFPRWNPPSRDHAV